MSHTVFTVGYEGRTIDEVIGALSGSGVELLVDVRYRAQSRKSGFSKTKMSEALAAQNIEYEHRRDLGTPPEMMKQRRETGGYELEEYAKYLDKNISALNEAVSDFGNRRVALLCYEKNAEECHRSVVASRWAELTGADVRHI